jgi:glycosyltransferase involved in cell wall biosynthesis
MASAGRYVKFQDPAFWQVMIEVLAENPEAYYVVMGVEESQIPFLPAMLSEEIRMRIRFLGWQGNEYLRSLCLADIFIDTFPSGGGTTLIDAIALGIPVVAFKNDYLRPYDQTDWSPAEEFEMPEIVAPRGDYAEMKRMVIRLIGDPDYRRRLGLGCQAQLRERRSNPARAVRACEDLCLRVLEQEALAGNQRRRVWSWTAGPAHKVAKLRRRIARKLGSYG